MTESECKSKLDSAHNITIEFLQDLLAGGDPNAIVHSFQVTAGSGRGDNYTAMMYRVRVHGASPRADGERHGWTRSLIYKCLPDNAAQRQAFKSDALFQNEVAVYTRALPALLAFQAAQGVQTPFRAVPRCLVARGDMLVLEDLKPLGFLMADRKAGLDEAQCRAVLRQLAQLHALSLAMKLLQPSRFHEVVASSVQEVLFVPENEEWYRGYYLAAAASAATMLQGSLPPGDDRARCIDKLQSFAGDSSFFGSMVELVTPQEPLAVLCHGDCWTNNILFRYSEDGDIQEVCLIDFQLSRYGSPALDLANLLYICTPRVLRARHMRSFLDDYHCALVAALAELGCYREGAPLSTPISDPDALRETLRAELRRCGRFAMGLALDMVPISTCDSEQAPDLYDTQDEQQQQGAVWSWKWNDACARKMANLVQELVENGDL